MTLADSRAFKATGRGNVQARASLDILVARNRTVLVDPNVKDCEHKHFKSPEIINASLYLLLAPTTTEVPGHVV
jgi:hypothetical protein